MSAERVLGAERRLPPVPTTPLPDVPAPPFWQEYPTTPEEALLPPVEPELPDPGRAAFVVPANLPVPDTGNGVFPGPEVEPGYAERVLADQSAMRKRIEEAKQEGFADGLSIFLPAVGELLVAGVLKPLDGKRNEDGSVDLERVSMDDLTAALPFAKELANRSIGRPLSSTERRQSTSGAAAAGAGDDSDIMGMATSWDD